METTPPPMGISLPKIYKLINLNSETLHRFKNTLWQLKLFLFSFFWQWMFIYIRHSYKILNFKLKRFLHHSLKVVCFLIAKTIRFKAVSEHSHDITVLHTLDWVKTLNWDRIKWFYLKTTWYTFIKYQKTKTSQR